MGERRQPARSGHSITRSGLARAAHRARVEENQKALTDAGHWGVPTFAFNGDPFFGEDRIDTLRWRLGKHRLQRA